MDNTAIIRSVLLLVILTLAAYKDYKDKQVYLLQMFAAGVLGILLHLFFLTPGLQDMLAGAAIGGAVIVVAKLSRESIGTGDGVILAVTGLFLGFWKNMELFLAALLLASLRALFLIVIKKKGRKYRLSFVPYLAVAYLLQLI